MLSNIFLHHVLDKWFEDVVRPRMRGKATLVRFADDFVMTFETYHDAKRVMDVLGKRLGRFGLKLHPDKTRFIDFRPQRHGGTPPDCKAPIVRLPRLHPLVGKVTEGQGRGAENNGQKPVCSLAGRGQGLVPDQPAPACTRTARLAVCSTQRSLRLLRHHGEHSAATGVSPPSRTDLAQVVGTSNTRKVVPMGQLQRVPHPSPAASGQDHSPLHLMERISRMRNRMRESCSSGSVGGEGGNRLAYPAYTGCQTKMVVTAALEPQPTSVITGD